MSAMLASLDESERFDARRCGSYVGTSAGSIVAAMLATGIDPRSRLGRMPEQPPVDESGGALPAAFGQALRTAASIGGVAAGRVAGVALRTSEPAGRLARRVALGRVPLGKGSLAALRREIDRSGARWDGRLRICAVELKSGRRVILDGSGGPEATVGQAVEASCAIPGVFRPVSLDGASYVDGGAWSPTNIDAAEVEPGDRVLCLNPTGSMKSGARTAFGGIAMISRSAAGLEAAALRSRGSSVRVISPDRDCVEAMGGSLMNPSNRAAVIAAGRAQGRRLARPPARA